MHRSLPRERTRQTTRPTYTHTAHRRQVQSASKATHLPHLHRPQRPLVNSVQVCLTPYSLREIVSLLSGMTLVPEQIAMSSPIPSLYQATMAACLHNRTAFLLTRVKPALAGSTSVWASHFSLSSQPRTPREIVSPRSRSVPWWWTCPRHGKGMFPPAQSLRQESTTAQVLGRTGIVNLVLAPLRLTQPCTQWLRLSEEAMGLKSRQWHSDLR